MSEQLLDAQEMEAIQAAIRETAPRRGGAAPAVEPTRLALIADDRVADAARPIMLALATRWIRIATRALRAHLPGRWQLDLAGAEIIDGPTAKDELRGGWVGGTSTELVVAALGDVVDVAAARRFGGAPSPASRPASAIALRLFEPTGRAVVDAWRASWTEVFDKPCATATDLAIVSRLIDARSVVRVAATLSGSVNGRMCCYARPEALVSAPTELAAIKANAARIANALSNVPVELVAELGTLRLPLAALRRLDSSTTHVLPRFIDALVPVYCGGVLKAWAKPVACRGVLAIEIVSVVHDQGSKS
jgi:flagellar motor switch/type III secretory pathway protein FliN